MKRFFVAGAVALALLIVLTASVGLFFVGRAYAQTQTPPAPLWGGQMMGGRGGMRGWHMGDTSYGPMHEYMNAALADALGLTPEELQTRIANGETPYQIALSQGLTDEQIRELFDQAHDQALEAAVEAGVITQEQAEWMEQHHDQMWANGLPGAGGCMGGAGRAWRGGRNNPSNP